MPFRWRLVTAHRRPIAIAGERCNMMSSRSDRALRATLATLRRDASRAAPRGLRPRGRGRQQKSRPEARPRDRASWGCPLQMTCDQRVRHHGLGRQASSGRGEAGQAKIRRTKGKRVMRRCMKVLLVVGMLAVLAGSSAYATTLYDVIDETAGKTLTYHFSNYDMGPATPRLFSAGCIGQLECYRRPECVRRNVDTEQRCTALGSPGTPGESLIWTA